MNVIASTIKKDIKIQKITYSFTVNENSFEANYFFGKNPNLEISHNGVSLGIISEKKTKFDFTINGETFPVKVTAWMNIGNAFLSFFNSVNNGIGIEVDGNPVQGTLADPEHHIKSGKGAYYLLLAILGLKSIVTYYSIYKEYSSHLAAAISCAIYFVPLLVAVLALIFYSRWTTFAVYYGFILTILEFIDYLSGLPNAISTGINPVSLLIWIGLRVSILLLFFNAFKWINRKRKMKVVKSSANAEKEAEAA